jgi:urease subunit alpha
MDNQVTRAGGAPDLVITNVTIIDAVLGVVKADVDIPQLDHHQGRS